MTPTAPSLASTFVEQVIRSGLVLADVVAELAEATPGDAYPGEQPMAVVLEMVAGSFGPAAEAAGRDALVSAIELTTSVVDCALADLQMILELRDATEASG